jgi:PBSX family phage terminase large subunit
MSTATDVGLSPAQQRSIAWSDARINIWSGTIRSGKTVASLLRFAMAVAAAGPGVITVTSKTFDTAYRNVFATLMDPAVMGSAAVMTDYTRGAPTATVLGREVDVITANDKRAEGRLRGATILIAYVDEITMIPKQFWDTLLGRMSGHGATLFGTTNPDAPGHWLNTGFLLPDGAGFGSVAHFVLTLADNPGLAPEYVEAIKREYTGLWYDRMILGKWCMAQGAIYDGWNPSINVVDTVPRIERWICDGVDYGTTNPFHAVKLGIGPDPAGGRALYVTDEWRYDSKIKHRQMTDVEYSREYRAWSESSPYGGGATVRAEYVAVDPSAASFRVQLYRDGWQSVAAKNEVAGDGGGLRTVSSLISAGKLKIARHCKHLIAEIPGYSWDDDAAQKGHDEPVKINDHGCDALRYAAKTTEPLWYRQIWG